MFTEIRKSYIPSFTKELKGYKNIVLTSYSTDSNICSDVDIIIDRQPGAEQLLKLYRMYAFGMDCGNNSFCSDKEQEEIEDAIFGVYYLILEGLNSSVNIVDP